MRKLLLLLLLTGLTFLVSNKANAQGVTTASINGIVTDAKGAIPGATVTITHTPTGTVYSTVSRTDGRFNIPNLRVGGPYTFKVSFVGYKDFVQDGISLNIGQDQRIPVALEDNTTTLGEVTITGAQGKVINSSRTGARETVNRQQIEALPTLNRSLQDFTKLTPSANGLNFGGRSSTYNNITVDGASFNNSFGLSGTLGGQTASQPISLDAIDQIQVDIAPYDIRQGNFTGAGVNTVVKSGTNEFKATIYDYFRGQNLVGYHVGPTNVPVTSLSYRQTGASIGGPIIKNKLFFFVSGEQERISTPANSFVASQAGLSGPNVSQAPAATLDAIKNKLLGLGYDPGAYENFNYKTYSDKLTVKLDWNIDKNNVLSAKYFYFKSYKDQPPSATGVSGLLGGSGSTRNASSVSLPFYGAGYRINNNFNIGIVELDTRVSNNMSNKLTLGYSALRDYRAILGNKDLPFVDIGNGTSDNLGNVITASSGVTTSFGYEVFTANNLLNTNIWQFSDDFTIFAGKHEFTFGTNDQLQKYTNGFAPNYNGLYSYNSASDFLNDLPAASYATRNSALTSGAFPFAKISASSFSLYAQDKFQATPDFKLTYGIRADYNVLPTKLDKNDPATKLTFQQGIHVDPSKLPKNRIVLSPRVGFNWDVNGDQSTQVRGGSGLFAGGVPFVWISNQASNNGLLFGSYTINKGAASNSAAQNQQLIFNPNPNAYRPDPKLATANTSYELDIADPNLKYPKIWRTNLAIDQRLPGGVVGTIEAAYTKDIHAIYHENLVLSDGVAVLPGGNGQIRYDSKNTTPAPNGTGTQSKDNPAITGLYYMTNTNKGFSYFVTGQLQKSFSNGFYANVAYTYTKSKDVNDGGSTASTIWSTRAVAGNPNDDNLSNSAYVQPNRIVASVAYHHEFVKNTNTSFGMVFEAANNGAVSYIVGNGGTGIGDVNNDNATNDLMYIPRNAAEINLVPDFAGDPRTAAQTYKQLEAFINQDKYLSAHRGQFAQRNGVILPTYKRADFNFTQDFYVKSGKVKNTLRFTIDIINVGNLLNRNWGVYQVPVNPVGSGGLVSILTYKGLNAAGQPTYSFPFADKNNLIPLTSSYKNDTNITFSRFQAQIGVRYIFN